jgi:hypothetical protein
MLTILLPVSIPIIIEQPERRLCYDELPYYRVVVSDGSTEALMTFEGVRGWYSYQTNTFHLVPDDLLTIFCEGFEAERQTQTLNTKEAR